MTIFGYMGHFRGQENLDALRAYGDKIAAQSGQTESLTYRAEDGTQACWGPTLSTDGQVTVVLEGRPTLAPSPADGSDRVDPAEAILAGYRRTGIAVLRTLTGPFSVAILDGGARRVLIGVDRMGIGRLAYAVQRDGIVFSTSASWVAGAPGVNAPLDQQSLFDYLLHHMIPAPSTVFRNVYKLRAASHALYENGNIGTGRYWTPRFDAHRDLQFAARKADLHQCLHDAVKSQLTGTTRVGTFLSGGLDSSTVAGVLSGVQGSPVETFSIGFGYPEYDELNYARIVNEHFACRGHEYVISGADIVDAFPLIARAYDEPFGNSSALPTYHCARLARDHGVRHLLAGDGGDELFAGNSRYADQQVFERYQRVPLPLRRRLLEPLLLRGSGPSALPLLRTARNYIEQSNTPLPDRLERWNLLLRLGFVGVLRADFLAAIDPEAAFGNMRALWASTPSDAYLHRMMYYDWQYTLADNDLRKVDTMCALAGVRVSYPMLHAAVVDMSTTVPPKLMMPGRKLRDFYKNAMRGFLPDAVILKKKHGFGLPFGLWLQESAPLRTLIFDNLSDLRKRGIIRPEFLDRLLHLHDREDARYYGVFVWVTAMLEQWMREHNVAV